MPYGKKPSESELTMLAHDVIVKDLEALISEVTKERQDFDHAVFTVIQIHKPSLETYIWPGTCYAIKNKEKYDLSSQIRC